MSNHESALDILLGFVSIPFTIVFLAKKELFRIPVFGWAMQSAGMIKIDRQNPERAKISLENDNSLKNTEALKKILEHLDIINKDMISILKKNNIEPIKSINEKLDSNLHQTMMEIEDDSKEPGTIVQEIQKGFLMKDRLLRPSLVGVSKKTQKNDEENRKDQENKEKNDKN